MNLIEKHDRSTPEDQMQEYVARYFDGYKWTPAVQSWKMVVPISKTFREVRIPDIGRISDVIVYVTPRKVINIECKTNDVPGVIEQAKDHLKWADYSYICLHALTYIAPKYIQDMVDLGIGLMLYQDDFCGNRPEFLADVIGARHNTKKRGKDPELRKRVNEILKKRAAIRTAENHEQIKMEINEL